MGDHQIEFQPIGRRGLCPESETLLACARRLGVEVSSLCGGTGTCNSCRVRVLEGRLSEVTPTQQEIFTAEELESGWRLACQTYPHSDCRVDVPPECMSAQQRLQVEGREIEVSPDPLVRAVA
ncbi:MAG: 2Fe-2S iron-sulfur cluster-binding protein [Desulfobacterales bacterium]